MIAFLAHPTLADPQPADFGRLLKQLEDALRRLKATTDDDARETAAHEVASARRALMAMVKRAAGRAPSHVQLPDGTLIVAGRDVWALEDDDENLIVIPPRRRAKTRA